MTTNIFNINHKSDEFTEKISIDELYESRHQNDLNQLELFNKILNRVHLKIKTTSRQKKDNQYCWFIVPEVIMGVSNYDHASCIAYLLDKLNTNGFNIKYIHPNAILICWAHWVPQYVRSEIKKKTGVVVNEYGIKQTTNNNTNNTNTNNTINNIHNIHNNTNTNNTTNNNTNTDNPNINLDDYANFDNYSNPVQKNTKKEYNSTSTYKPSGNLLYNNDYLNNISNH